MKIKNIKVIAFLSNLEKSFGKQSDGNGGIYVDNAKNRKLGRVGQHYGGSSKFEKNDKDKINDIEGIFPGSSIYNGAFIKGYELAMNKKYRRDENGNFIPRYSIFSDGGLKQFHTEDKEEFLNKVNELKQKQKIIKNKPKEKDKHEFDLANLKYISLQNENNEKISPENQAKLIEANKTYRKLLEEGGKELNLDLSDANPLSIVLNNGELSFEKTRRGYDLFGGEGMFPYGSFSRDEMADIIDHVQRNVESNIMDILEREEGDTPSKQNNKEEKIPFEIDKESGNGSDNNPFKHY